MSKFHCQIYEDSFSSTTTNQRCVNQCEVCKTALEKRKTHNKIKNKNRSKRYYLHSVIKGQGCNFNARKRTIYIPNDQFKLTKQVKRLRDEFGYSVQIEIT